MIAKETLFTFLVEYKGGTYIRQVKADSLASATETWRVGALEEVAKLSATPLSRFQNLFDNEPVRIDQCSNVWCLSATADKQFLLMNIVATIDQAMPESRTS